jgi:redox-sensitive bicupin YhaK (pirin superfamily)
MRTPPLHVDQDEGVNRRVLQVTDGLATSDGAGVQLTRLMGSDELNILDPSLLFDVFRSDQARDYIAGFPPHPHRGFETVTYLLNGRMRHEDNRGHSGVIESGGVQWMTAAKGIVHSEMPEQEDGLLEGFQLWVNLPRALKMSEPGYQEFPKTAIPVEQREGGAKVRVVAGRTSRGTSSPVTHVPTEPLYLDVSLDTGGVFVEPVPPEHNAFLYTIAGSIQVVGENATLDKVVDARVLAVLADGNRVQIISHDPRSRFLLITGQRLNEPVARGGPFVMNTKAEILQAFQDYEQGNL